MNAIIGGSELRCLMCHNNKLTINADAIVCRDCGEIYLIVSGTPVFIRSDNSIFPPSAYLENGQKNIGLEKRKRIGRLGRFLPSISVNLSSKLCLAKFAEILPSDAPARVLVVGGGTQRKWLDKRFSSYPHIKLVYTDIDKNALVDCFCDAHDLPFTDGSFDGVITTAVLMLVLNPERAVAEIHRVLKPSGLIYSEMAFMQQVVEGAYDFTRYTLSGHRRLFNHFEEIETGLVAGPATALVWSIENFVLAFFRKSFLRLFTKTGVRLFLFWIKYFDYYLCRNVQAMDGASCTYFLGSKIMGIVSDLSIIEKYRGAKHMEHV